MLRRDFIKMAGSADAKSDVGEQSPGATRRQLSRTHRFLMLFAGAVLGFCAMGTAVAFTIDVPHLLLVRHRNAQTDGKVIRHIPDSHGMVEIEYSVAGRPYRRPLRPEGVGLSWAVGDTVAVYYYPDDPEIAFTQSAGEILAAELPAWIGGSLLGSVFGIVVAVHMLRVRERGWLALFAH